MAGMTSMTRMNNSAGPMKITDTRPVVDPDASLVVRVAAHAESGADQQGRDEAGDHRRGGRSVAQVGGAPRTEDPPERAAEQRAVRAAGGAAAAPRPAPSATPITV